MVSLASLWLPIVVSAVLVFLTSSILHMVLKYHRADYRKLPTEDAALEALRGTPPGYYPLPYCTDPKEMAHPEMAAKYQNGPVGILTVVPSGPPNMGRLLGQWFVYCLVIALFSGYLASRTVASATEYLAVFRVVGTTAFMGFGLGELSNSIWRGQPWGNTLRALVDGLIYALVTAGTFGWLWPR